jgi:hypothetical protein
VKTNPYTTTLSVIWALGAIAGTILLWVGGAGADDYGNSGSTLQLIWGSAFVSLSVIAGLVHLGVNAVLWRAP